MPDGLTAAPPATAPRALHRCLQRLTRETLLGASRLAAVAGHYRLPVNTITETEPIEPRRFTVTDRLAEVDWRHLPPSAFRSLTAAIIQGDLTIPRSRQRNSSTFCVTVDLSRSMLASQFDAGDGPRPPGAKLRALYFAIASFCTVGEGAGYGMHGIYQSGTRWTADEVRRPVDFARRALQRSGLLLEGAYAEALTGHALREPWTLERALRRLLVLNAGCVIVVISDWLDPFETYAEMICHLARRHSLILVDVALPHERRWPRARWLADYYRPCVITREGPRHLERELDEVIVVDPLIDEWNEEQTTNRQRLVWLTRQLGHGLVRFTGESYAQGFVAARDAFAQVH